MGAIENFTLSHCLKQLTLVFADFLLAKDAALDTSSVTFPAGLKQSLSASRVPKWLARLSVSVPLDVTAALFKQMKSAQQSKNDKRFQAQVALLEFLVVEGIAIDLGTYSAYHFDNH